MNIADLVIPLRIDIGDEELVLFTDDTLLRCLSRAVPKVARDLGKRWVLASGEIIPAPADGEEVDLLVLMAQINACEVKRGETANAFVTSSGDKRVDKTNQQDAWAKLQTDLMLRYREAVQALNPPIVTDDGLLHPPSMVPVIYEPGSGDEGPELVTTAI